MRQRLELLRTAKILKLPQRFLPGISSKAQRILSSVAGNFAARDLSQDRSLGAAYLNGQWAPIGIGAPLPNRLVHRTGLRWSNGEHAGRRRSTYPKFRYSCP